MSLEGALVGALIGALIGALERRAPLLASLEREETDCVRLLHGSAEGVPGLAIDRYGPVLLVQTWREALSTDELDVIERTVASVVSGLRLVWNHRGDAEGGSPDAPTEAIGRELGLRYDVRPRHRGQDPLLFLDFRVARRWIRNNAANQTVLNLFAYTSGMGLAAARGGARHVLNVDFARSALEVAEANRALNGIEATQFEVLRGDAQVIARQLAGLRATGRQNRDGARGRPAPTRALPPLPPRSFDIVVLDPPRWAKSAFGAVDVVRDYPSLFKPALLCTRPGGVVLATNHVPSVDRATWHATLKRTAEKAGRPLTAIDVLVPEADFPSFDGSPPLKIALCRVGEPT